MNQVNQHSYQIELADTNHKVLIEETQEPSIFTVRTQSLSSVCSAHLHDRELICTINGYRQSLIISQDKNKQFIIFSQNGTTAFKIALPDLGESQNNHGNSSFIAPMNGTIAHVLVKENEQVQQGQALLILEAMKMQHTISAPTDGEIKALYFKTGDLVDGGALLLNFIAAEEE